MTDRRLDDVYVGSCDPHRILLPGYITLAHSLVSLHPTTSTSRLSLSMENAGSNITDN